MWRHCQSFDKRSCPNNSWIRKCDKNGGRYIEGDFKVVRHSSTHYVLYISF